MSKKSIQPLIAAFLEGKPCKTRNTQTDGTRLYLFGNIIARKNDDGTISITSAGWPTNTTKDRLNGLPGVSIVQKNYEWFLNGESWDGGWKTI